MDTIDLIIKMLLKKALKFLKYYLILIITVLLVFTCIGGMISIFFDALTGKDADSWSQNISNEEIHSLMDEGSPINPKKIPLYKEVENKSYIKTRQITTSTINNGNVSAIKLSVDVTNLTYPYRIPWQFIAVLDAAMQNGDDINDKTVTNEALKYLIPTVVWSNGIYKAIDRTEIKTWINIDGEDKPSTTKTTSVSTEQPYISRITTALKSYEFSYKQTTKNAQSGTTLLSERQVKDKNGIHIVKTYQSISTSSSKFSLKAIAEIDDNQKFDLFMKSTKMDENELQMATTMALQVPELTDIGLDMQDVYDLDDVNVEEIADGNGAISIDDGQAIKINPSEISSSANIPYFSQKDSRWGKKHYGYDKFGNPMTLAAAACGPTSMAMVITGLGGYNEGMDLNKDKIIDPYEASRWSMKNGLYSKGVGTSWSFYSAISNACGLTSREYGPGSYKTIYSELASGKVVIASMKPGVFTKYGHFIVLRGLDSDGDVYVNDPNSIERSKITWDFMNPIALQCKQYWVISR